MGRNSSAESSFGMGLSTFTRYIRLYFFAGYLRLAMFKILTSKDFWQGLWVYLTSYIPNRLWVSTFLIFPTSLCGVVVFRFAPALPPSAFRLPPPRRLVLAFHISHTNSSHSTQLTHQLTPHMALTPTHHTALSSHHTHHTHLTPHMALTPTHHTALSSHHTHHTHLTPHMALTPTHHTCQAKCGGMWRRSTQSLLAELLRAWSPLAVVWQAQYTEPSGGAAARVGVAGVALGDMDLRFAWQAWHLVTSTLQASPSLWNTTLSHTHTLCHAQSFTSLSHAALSHATLSNTTLSHTTFSHTSLSHTTLSPTAVSHTQNFVTHKFVTHTQLCHTQSLSHTTLSHTAFSHTTLSPTTLSHTIFHTTLYNFVTDNLSHTQLCHTQSFTHTTLSQTIFHTHTQLFHSQLFTHNSFTHTTFSHNSSHRNRTLKWLTIHHLLCLFFFLRATATTFSDYWKKLTCGAIRSFYYNIPH